MEPDDLPRLRGGGGEAPAAAALPAEAEADEDAYALTTTARNSGRHSGSGTLDDPFDVTPHAASTPRRSTAPRRSSRSSVDASADAAALVRDRLRGFLTAQVGLACVVRARALPADLRRRAARVRVLRVRAKAARAGAHAPHGGGTVWPCIVLLRLSELTLRLFVVLPPRRLQHTARWPSRASRRWTRRARVWPRRRTRRLAAYWCF
jgi:hypothetical protein